jgi:hypothetical protein
LVKLDHRFSAPGVGLVMTLERGKEDAKELSQSGNIVV